MFFVYRKEKQYVNKMEEENLSKHDIKQLKKEEKEKERTEKEKAMDKLRLTKNMARYGGLTIVLLAIIVLIFVFNKKGVDGSAVKEGPYTSGQVHWHASLQVFTCATYREMPKPVGGENAHLGTPLLHTHKDGLIHIEGRVYKKNDIMFGQYMENIGVRFSNDTILNYKNGDGCSDGKENKVKMFVNGEENFDYIEYVLNDGDKIEIRYE